MIVSRQNRKIKDIRRLRRCKGDLAVLEGPHLVTDAVHAGLLLEEVLVTPEFIERPEGRRLEPLLPRAPSLVSAAILDQLCDADSPRGILAVARIERPGLDALRLPPRHLVVVGEGLQDPGNVGALARATEAASGDGLALTLGSAHPNHPRALRGSAGSLLRLPTAVDVELSEVRSALQPGACPIVALVAHGGIDLFAADLDPPLVLVVGAEGPGLSHETLDLADRRVTIPLSANVESLNTTVAAAIVLFEVKRRRDVSNR